MKKIAAIAIIPFFLLTACGGAIPSMTTDVKTTPKLIAQEAKPASLRDLVAGGPLYVPDVDSANPTLKAYRTLRLARANELIAMIGEAREEIEETLAEMPAFRSQIITFLSNLAASVDTSSPDQAQLATIALDTIDRLLASAVETAAAYANLESMSEALAETKVPEDAKDNAVIPMFRYAEYVLLQKLAATIGREITYLPARAAGIVLIVKANDEILGKKVRNLTKKFDKKFGKRLAKISESYAEAIGTQLDLAVGFDSLAAADYAFTMATLDFAEKKLPEIAKQAQEVKTGDVVSGEDKAFSVDYARFLENFTGDMRKGIERTAPPPFLENLEHFASVGNLIPPFEGVANAGVSDWLEKTSSALTAGLAGAGNVMYGGAAAAADCVTSPWKCTKAAASTAGTVAYNAASATYNVADTVAGATGAKAAFKFGQKATGVVVDCVAFPAIIVANEASGLYYGTSRKETAKRGADQLVEMFKSWDEGKPGSVTLGGGIGALSGTEEAMGAATGAIVGGVLGVGGAIIDKVTPQIVKDAAGTLADGADWLGKKATGYSIKETFTAGNASWATGKLAEMTTGMVTGFGKGMMQLANSESSPGELAEGLINVAFSFIGGSKAVVKASQAGAGVKKLGQELGEKATSMASQLELKLQNKALKGEVDDIMKIATENLDGKKIAELARKQAEIAENVLKKQLLQQQEKSVARILGELKDKAGQKILGNLDEAKEGARGFVNKGFDASMAGLKESAGEITGRTFKDYADNILGGMVDSTITGLAKAGVMSMVGPEDQKAIDKVEANASPLLAMGLDPKDPAVQQAMAKIAVVREETQAALASVPEAAKAIGAEKANEAVKEELAKNVTAEADKVLSTPVKAHGSFSGDYKGSVSMTLTPGGGGVSGTVTTKYGTAAISGSVSPGGKLTASVSGSMKYEYYPDGNTLEMRICTLSALMTGSVAGRRASGTYSGSCALEGDSGTWLASW